MANKEWYVGEVRDTVHRAEKMGKYGLSGFAPAILSVAITGGMHTKAKCPVLPETVDEQVQAVKDAYNAGAVLVHVHARDKQDTSKMCMDSDPFIEVNRRIREACPDIIINNTFVGARMFYMEKASDPVWRVSAEARPEVASLDICRNLYDFMPNVVFAQTMGDCEENMALLDKYGAKAEIECFDLGDIQFLNRMIQKGILKDPYWVQMIFNGTGITPCLETLLLAERLLPEKSLLSVLGIGSVQTPMAAAAMILGHHIRTGLEDNIYYKRGEMATSNAQLVERLVRMANDMDRPLATPAQAREMMGLGEPRQYS